MNVLMAQLNYIVGDIAGNTQEMKKVLLSADGNVDVVVFSELCITGYYPKDLLLNSRLIEQQEEAINDLVDLSKQLNCGFVIGVVEKNRFAGKPFHNSLYLVHDGNIQYRYRKQLLPTYGVFSEARHFEPGNQPGYTEWNGNRIGFLICEDAWLDSESPLYTNDPVSGLVGQNLDCIISINASPSHAGKREERNQLLSTTAKRVKAPLVYVNQVGGIDDVVFDGGSIVFDAQGYAIAEASSFTECTVLVDLMNAHRIELTEHYCLRYVAEQLKLGLKDYLGKSGFQKVVIGESGGIDSALTTAIAVWAIGAENVTGVTMPSKYSSAGSVDDSQALCDNLGIPLVNLEIKSAFDQMVSAYNSAFQSDASGLAQENLQARIRGTYLMTYSNTTSAMVLSTGNKSELAVGYCTLYGDMNGGLAVLGDVLKTDVFKLARFMNEEIFGQEVIPNAIINKPPSAELAEGQVDSDSLPDYDILDAILKLYLESDLLSGAETDTLKKIAFQNGKDEVVRIHKLVDRNEYKRNQGAPVIRVNTRAFGYDRQVPITARLDQSLS